MRKNKFSPRPNSLRPVCKRGHDTSLTGRTKQNTCQTCENELRWIRLGIKVGDAYFETSDYNRNFQIQGGRCLGCQKHASELTRPLVVDHDHTTSQFRGLLCMPCNIKLGTYESVKSWAGNYLNLKQV